MHKISNLNIYPIKKEEGNLIPQNTDNTQTHFKTPQEKPIKSILVPKNTTSAAHISDSKLSVLASQFSYARKYQALWNNPVRRLQCDPEKRTSLAKLNEAWHEVYLTATQKHVVEDPSNVTFDKEMTVKEIGNLAHDTEARNSIETEFSEEKRRTARLDIFRELMRQPGQLEYKAGARIEHLLVDFQREVNAQEFNQWLHNEESKEHVLSENEELQIIENSENNPVSNDFEEEKQNKKEEPL